MSAERPPEPRLPVLEEVGDALREKYAKDERQQRIRRRAVPGAAAALGVVVALILLLLPRDPAAFEVASVGLDRETVEFELVKAKTGVCLQPKPSAQERRGSCVAAPSAGRTAGTEYAAAGGQLLYGFAREPSLRIRSVKDGDVRTIDTRSIPPEARRRYKLPADLRVYIVPAPPGGGTVSITRP